MNAKPRRTLGTRYTADSRGEYHFALGLDTSTVDPTVLTTAQLPIVAAFARYVYFLDYYTQEAASWGDIQFV
jgi:hypothetical protein